MNVDTSKNTNIDLVYLWVDGSDPAWLAKKNAFTGTAEETSSVNCKGRYANNDELKYSLRSVEKYAPWIRKIFIVTDGQTPTWLDTENPRGSIIDIEEIMPKESLPCFNSAAIEARLYKIPELSERFLYANDDMFINKPVTPETFFSADGFPIIRLRRKRFRRAQWFFRERIRRKPLHVYSKTIANASELVKKHLGIYCTGMPHHNIDAYLKSYWQRVTEDLFKDEYKLVLTNHLRSRNDIQRVIYQYAALAERTGHLRYVTEKESCYLDIHKKHHYTELDKYDPILFCMNDSQYASNHDRTDFAAWLDRRFPDKSSFEK